MPKQPKNPRAGVEVTDNRYKDHAYLNPDGSVDGEKLLAVVRRSPGAFDLITLGAMVEGGDIAVEYNDAAVEIVSALTVVIMLAGCGDEQSKVQLEAIKKLVRPAKYELPANKIRELVDRYETSPPLARGWELRQIMSHLSNVVEPLKSDKPFSQEQPIKLRDKRDRPLAAYFVRLLELAKQHWKPNTTLQSLAIHIYLEQLQQQGIIDEGAAITYRSLKRDLELVKAWENTASEDEKTRRGRWEGFSLTDEPIIWYEFSEGWKVRRIAAITKKTLKQAKERMGSKERKKLT